MKIADLFASIGFVITGKREADDAKETLLQTTLASIKAAVSIAAVTAAYYELMHGARETAVEMKKFIALTGLSSEELQRWQYVAEKNDVSGQEMADTLKHLSDASAALKVGQGNVAPWQFFSVNPHQDPGQVLKDLQKAIVGLDPAIARTMLHAAGLSDNIVQMLRTGSLELDKLDKKYLLTKREQSDILKLNRTWKDFTVTIKAIKDRMAALLTGPAAALMQIFKGSAEALMNFTHWLQGGSEAADKFASVLKVIGVIAAGVAVSFAPWTAAFVALMAVIEDIYVYSIGGKSGIGLLIDYIKKEFPEIIPQLRALMDEVKALGTEIWQTLTANKDTIHDIFVGTFNLALEGWKILVDAIRSDLWLLDKAWMIGKTAGILVNRAIHGENSDSENKYMKDKFGLNTGPFKPDYLTGTLPNITNNTVKIDVTGNDKPAETARRTVDELSNILDGTWRGGAPAHAY